MTKKYEARMLENQTSVNLLPKAIMQIHVVPVWKMRREGTNHKGTDTKKMTRWMRKTTRHQITQE